MRDEMKPPEGPESTDAADDAIARLIRLAGPRPAVAEERTARVRENVRARWREAVRRERRRGAIRVALPLAAALLLVAGVALWLRGSSGVSDSAVATVVRLEGQVFSHDGPGARTGAALAAGTGLRTGPDGRAALRLAGGGSVRL